MDNFLSFFKTTESPTSVSKSQSFENLGAEADTVVQDANITLNVEKSSLHNGVPADTIVKEYLRMDSRGVSPHVGLPRFSDSSAPPEVADAPVDSEVTDQAVAPSDVAVAAVAEVLRKAAEAVAREVEDKAVYDEITQSAADSDGTGAYDDEPEADNDDDEEETEEEESEDEYEEASQYGSVDDLGSAIGSPAHEIRGLGTGLVDIVGLVRPPTGDLVEVEVPEFSRSAFASPRSEVVVEEDVQVIEEAPEVVPEISSEQSEAKEEVQEAEIKLEVQVESQVVSEGQEVIAEELNEVSAVKEPEETAEPLADSAATAAIVTSAVSELDDEAAAAADALAERLTEGDVQAADAPADQLTDGEVQGADEDEEWEEEEGDEEDEDEDEDEEAMGQEEFVRLLQEAAAAAQGRPPAAPPAAEDGESGPRGLGSASLPPRRESRANGNSAVSSLSSSASGPASRPPPAAETDEERIRREKIMGFRVQLIRAALRLGEGAEHSAVSQVLYRLRLLELALSGGSAWGGSQDGVDVEAVRIAKEKEAEEEESRLDLDCTVLVLGKAGSGKTSTIRSLLEGSPVEIASGPTKSTQELKTVIKGVHVTFIDTVGLSIAAGDQEGNRKMLSSLKKRLGKKEPDIVLYFDRLDWMADPKNDLPLLRTISSVFGPQLWFNSMLVLTHGAAAPPNDPRGNPVPFDRFLGQRSFALQQALRAATGEVRLQVPTTLVENHPKCRRNRADQPVLPNGMAWKSQLLMLCFASVTLSNTNSMMRAHELARLKLKPKKSILAKFGDAVSVLLGRSKSELKAGPGGLRFMRPRHNSLPFLLSQLLQAKEALRSAEDQNAMEEELDEDILEEGELVFEDDDVPLPPFARLSEKDIKKLVPQQRKEYFRELREREKILQRQQFREQLKERREARRRQLIETIESDLKTKKQVEENNEAPSMLPDIQLPLSFDADTPAYRYRSLDDSTWQVRPLLGQQVWDHDPGFDTFSVEKAASLADNVPASITAQISKDKTDGSIILEASASKWHGEVSGVTPVTTGSLDVQSMGKDLSYTVRLDHRLSTFGRNKTTAGISLNMIGGVFTYGLKLEDRLSLGRRGKVSGGVGLVSGKGDRAVGSQLEITINHSKDFPMDRSATTVGVSVMEWQKDVSVGANVSTSFPVSRTNLGARLNLNNRGAGQISLRATTNEEVQIAAIALIPLLRHFIGYRLFGGAGFGDGAP